MKSFAHLQRTEGQNYKEERGKKKPSEPEQVGNFLEREETDMEQRNNNCRHAEDQHPGQNGAYPQSLHLP